MSQADSSLVQILNNWAAAETPTALDWQQLAAAPLESPLWTSVFALTPANVEEVIQGRSHSGFTSLTHVLQAVYSDILSLPPFQTPTKHSREAEEISPSKSQNLNSKILLSLCKLWLPLALQLAIGQKQLGRPLIQGILGGQGTGKTTLGTVLTLILAQLGYRTLSLSLDDLYKTYAERQQLQEKDPRLGWRGPPGTHDIELGIELLDQLRQPNPVKPILVPRFDKSAWEGLDRLMLLYPTDYRLSQQWRRQAEQQMIATGKSGMADAQIDRFVEYFWKSLHPELFIIPLTQNPSYVD